jgi:hypothetical protein
VQRARNGTWDIMREKRESKTEEAGYEQRKQTR